MKHKTLPLRALTSKERSSEKGAFTGEAESRAGEGKDNYQRGPNILKVSVTIEIRPHHEKVVKSVKEKNPGKESKESVVIGIYTLRHYHQLLPQVETRQKNGQVQKKASLIVLR